MYPVIGNFTEQILTLPREVVVTQLVEWSIPTPEVRGSNPVISKTSIEHLYTVNCIEKTKIKKKRPGMDHFNFLLYLKITIPRMAQFKTRLHTFYRQLVLSGKQVHKACRKKLSG